MTHVSLPRWTDSESADLWTKNRVHFETRTMWKAHISTSSRCHKNEEKLTIIWRLMTSIFIIFLLWIHKPFDLMVGRFLASSTINSMGKPPQTLSLTSQVSSLVLLGLGEASFSGVSSIVWMVWFSFSGLLHSSVVSARGGFSKLLLSRLTSEKSYTMILLKIIG